MGEIIKSNRTNQFGQIYETMCNKNRVSPLSTVQAHSTENRLKFCCDRVSHEDWSPILNALAVDRSLVEIYVYSRNKKKKINEAIDTENKLNEYRKHRRTNSRGPMIYTNFLMRCFIDAVAVCTRDSNILTSLCLDGIPLNCPKYLNILCVGLSSNRNLRDISLARCRIGDEGCDILLRSCSKNPSLRHIDLTACRLTSKSALHVTSFLKKRRSKLLTNAWNQSSLPAETEATEGVHTLILDRNKRFSDAGLRPLTYALKGDFWLKSLSLRGCGLTKKSTDAIIDLLETNSILVTINFQDNDLPLEMLKTMKKLLTRRLEKGERISLKRRLINRKKDLRWKLRKHSACKTGKDKQNLPRVNSMRIVIKSRENRFSSRTKDDKGSNLKELKERLSNLINCNRKLNRCLMNKRHLLVNEKHSRLNAEKSYQLLTPVIEKLRNGFQRQNRTRARVLFESYLCTDIRKIFRDLENISAVNAKVIETKLNDENIITVAEESTMKKLSVHRFDERKKIYCGVQKRPHCPPRQKV